MSTKAEVAASIEAAKVELEQALVHLMQLPALDWGSVRRAAHTLGNYLNINNATVLRSTGDRFAGLLTRWGTT
jgi:hypothetical protein